MLLTAVPIPRGVWSTSRAWSIQGWKWVLQKSTFLFSEALPVARSPSGLIHLLFTKKLSKALNSSILKTKDIMPRLPGCSPLKWGRYKIYHKYSSCLFLCIISLNFPLIFLKIELWLPNSHGKLINF